MQIRTSQNILLLSTAAMVIAAPAAAYAQPYQVHNFDLPAQELDVSLRQVASQASLQLYGAAEDINHLQAPKLQGQMPLQQAIDLLLDGTDLRAELVDNAILIRKISSAKRIPSADQNSDTIVVTGTHIRQVPPNSLVISSSRESIKSTGAPDLGTFIRNIPQNFGGGQNPGIVGGGVQGGHANLNASSALNLRGLGPDATLTLINGHRVAYDGAAQGVDISAIPLNAIERVEIIASGASALYGSDAVGGVANVILRKDYDGAEISARLEATTDGGGWGQRYDLVLGQTWSAGSILLAGNFNKSTAINAHQREYTRSLSPEATLVPSQKQYAFVLNTEYALSEDLRFQLDGQYSRRKSEHAIAATNTNSPKVDGTIARPDAKTYSISPSLKWNISPDWQVSLGGTYGQSDTVSSSLSASGGDVYGKTNVRYQHRLTLIEAKADGPLFQLPGGDVRLAIGGGSRATSFDAKAVSVISGRTIQTLDASPNQNILYGFGELSIPIFDEPNRWALVDLLRLSAAMRYERYSGLATVASPKFGVAYRPVSDVTILASWGKSFKVPTFYERFRGFQTILYPATNFGGTDPAQTALYIAGGNPGLRPERAKTWTSSIIFEPKAVSDLRLELGYFNIRYRNRVVRPIASSLGLFDNPLYQHLITFSPSASQIDDLVSGSIFGLENYTGQSFDPSQVAALIYANVQNSATYKAKGLDFNASYIWRPSVDDQINLRTSASYLHSQRELLAGQPYQPASGIVFMPPKWRVQAQASWIRDNVSLSASANFISSSLDNRRAPDVRIGSFLSVDLNALVRSAAQSGPFRGTELGVSLLNIFNRAPSYVRTSSVTEANYDSTNHSAIGRQIAFTLTKEF